MKWPYGKNDAEMVRVRLGTRLPVYLPQRITPALSHILKEFREKASEVGIRQFIIQTHFESPMEVTPEAKAAVARLLSAGWMVTNQLVFTSSASRRGHTAQLRKVLNDVGVLPYYTFTVKGYMENYSNFANNARVMQEQEEEKVLGKIMPRHYNTFRDMSVDAEGMVSRLETIRKELNVPFLASDRNVLNLPGVGKSLTFRVIGITRDGRRILQFDYDRSRKHSPIINKMGKIIIIESKSVSDYLAQLDEMGEDVGEYRNIYGYSIGETKPQMPVFEYPPCHYDITRNMTNLDVKSNFTLLEKLLEENAFI
jgi:lysine 2,3-aminomutase